jgi:hypothetical protein
MTQTRFARTALVYLLTALPACHHLPASPVCGTTGPPRSAIAAEPTVSGGIHGRVLEVASGRPAVGAAVILEPGHRIADVYQNGAFQFPAVPRGVYVVRALRVSWLAAQDTLTFAGGGLALVAMLAPVPVGLKECVPLTP